MFFKNLSLLNFTELFALATYELESRLAQRRFRPCGSLEPVSAGWVSPIGREGAPLVHAANGFLMICLKREEKILPAAAVNEIVNRRAAEVEEGRGTPLRRKERDALRDEVMQDLLPRALTSSRLTYAYIDPKDGWLVVDSPSGKRTDELTSILRQCLGSLPVVPFATKKRPSAIMTNWLASDDNVPKGFTLENEAELRSPKEDGGIVRCRRHDLCADEIHNHIDAGKEVIKLALTWNDRASFVLGEDLSIKRLRFLNVVQEAAREGDPEDAAQIFDAEFVVMTSEVRELISAITEVFGGLNLAAK